MGLYDREYYRDDDADGGWLQGRAVVWLIGVIGVVYFLQLLARAPGDRHMDELLRFGGMDVSKVLSGQVWRFLTASFLHDPANLLIVVFNLILLYMFGHPIEQVHGSKEFLGFFLAACLASQAGAFAAQWSGRWVPYSTPQLPVAEMARQGGPEMEEAIRQQAGGAMEEAMRQFARIVPPPAYGCAGAVMACTVVFLFLHPGTQLPLVRLPFWPLIAVILGLDALALLSGRYVPMTGNPGMNLAGAAFGLAYHRFGWRVSNLLPAGGSFARRRSRPSLRVVPRDDAADDDEPQPVPAAAAPRKAQGGVDEQLEAKLDHVLEKVARLGRDSLTPDETQILLRASEIYKRRRGS